MAVSGGAYCCLLVLAETLQLPQSLVWRELASEYRAVSSKLRACSGPTRPITDSPSASFLWRLSKASRSL